VGEALLHAVELHAYYGLSHILRGVSFSVSRGETVGLPIGSRGTMQEHLGV